MSHNDLYIIVSLPFSEKHRSVYLECGEWDDLKECVLLGKVYVDFVKDSGYKFFHSKHEAERFLTTFEYTGDLEVWNVADLRREYEGLCGK
jgi:hypothetical protein